MKKIIFIFLARPVTAGMLFFSVLVLGAASFFNLPVELLPHAEYPRLSVSCSWAGVSPEAVEAYLTSPMEAALAGIKGIKKISSRSSEGSSYINLEFHPSTNMDFARLEINEKLGALMEELPENISPPRISAYLPKEFRDMQGFLTYTLSAELTANEIRKYAVDYIKTPLLSVNGVSDVNIRGGNDREILITIDYDRAKSFNISNEEISAAINNAEQIISAGMINNRGAQVSVKINNTINSADILLNQPVKTFQNSVIRIKDIGIVIDDFSERQNYYRINGNEAVFIEISKEPGKNTIQTADNVYKKLNELEAAFPPGFSLQKEIDMSRNIRDEIDELFSSAGYSFLIVLVVLLLIFRDAVYSFIVIISILFSMLSAFIFLYVFNISLNILTIASLIIGFGLIVDNSIVVVDYLDKHSNESEINSGRQKKRLSVHTKNIFFPVFASTLTTVAVFIPLLFLTGELKLYFEQFAITTALTLTSALIISFTIVPVLFYNYKKIKKIKSLPEKNHHASNFRNRFSGLRIYSFTVQLIYRWRKLSIVVLILIVGLPVWLLPTTIETPVLSFPYNAVFGSQTFDEIKKYFNYALGGTLNLFFNHVQKGEVFSYGESDYIVVRLQLPNGNRIERINELTEKFENEVLTYKENIENITANVMDEETALIRIIFTKEQSRSAFPYILKNYLTAFAVGLGGLDVSVFGYGPGFSSGGYSTTSFIVQAAGFNYNRVKDLANQLKEILEKNPRIDNVDVDRSGFWGSRDDTYEIAAEIKRQALIKNNIDVNQLFNIIAKNTRGNLGNNRFRIDGEEAAYSVKFSNYKNIQQEELANKIITVDKFKSAKINELVFFEERKVLSTINRENQQYVRNISFDYKGPYMYGMEFLKSSIEQISIPEGYSIKKQDFFFTFGTEEEIEVWKILALSLILIFMITSALFESIKKPLIVFIAIPFALIGTIFLFYLGDFSLDRGAYAGMLLLIGLSVNNSIILVDYLSQNIKSSDLTEIIKLSFNRIRPIATTTLTTASALIPLMLSSGQSFWKSLALSVTGGIIISSTFILFLVPVLYYILTNKKKVYA